MTSRTPLRDGGRRSDPAVSIVIPTRNRAELLGRAIASACAQTLDDVEIVVSNNASDDDTDAVVREFDDPRVRLVHTPDSCLMHDSWRFALGKSRGRLVTFLCDDDALHPRAMEIVTRVLERTGADVLSWGSCSFFWPDWPDEGARTSFRFGPAFTDAVLEVDPARLLDLAYDLRVCHTNMTPKVLNCAMQRDLLDRIEAAGDRLFLPSCPDYSAMVTLAAHVAASTTGGGRMVHIDTPLLVTGASRRSIGASNSRASDAVTLEFVNQLLEREPDMIVPHMLVTCTPWIAQTYQQCALACSLLADRPVNLVHAYGLSAREWMQWRAAGDDVDDVEAAFDAALDGPLAEHAAAIRAFIEDGRTIESESFLGRAALNQPALGIGPFHAPPGCGRDVDIEHIDDFAAFIDSWIDERSARLESFWPDLAHLAGDRAIVVYGLGRNGRSLLRLARLTGFRSDIVVLDDHADRTPDGCTRLASPGELSPQSHCVLVTPDGRDAIARTLADRGLLRDRHWFTPNDIARRAAVPA